MKGKEYVVREILDSVSYDIFLVVRMVKQERYLLILDCLISMLLFGVETVLRTLCHLEGCIGTPRRLR